MGLFDKKFCDICGEKIGLLGNRKLEDGNMCKDCAKKLSPFMTDRRQSTLAEIKDHLSYREANKEKVAAFQPTKVIGGDTKIYFDENKKQWLVTRLRDWRSENPDIMDFSQVTGCVLDIDENKSEIYQDGTIDSFNPPRYNYSYEFKMTIFVNSPWFEEIQFLINDGSINQLGGAYYATQAKADEIKQTLEQVREAERDTSKPKVAMDCPHCHATTVPDANGCCEYCGGAMGS
jgi:hypothetical protein